ncbi:MAG: hypothetical protein PGN11_05875 [Quadrisphaera sp.]
MTDEPIPQFHHPDVWRSRDRPVLMAVVDHFDGELGTLLRIAELADTVGMAPAVAAKAVVNLERGRYLTTQFFMGGAENGMVTGITERALTETGLWPDNGDVVDRLLWVLEQRIASAPTDERSKLVKLRDGIASMGRELTVEVLGAAITGRLPM